MKIFINFKNYPSGIGEKQVEILDFLEELSLSSPSSFSSVSPSPSSLSSPRSLHLQLVVPATEIAPIWEKYSFPLWSQHCDPVDSTRATGWVSAEMIKEAGAVGTMLNHSEHRLPFSTLQKTVEICRQKNLKILICCQNVEEGKLFAEKLKPDFLAYEPPELIASKTTSVISSKNSLSSLITLISLSPQIPLVVGAGIHTHADILEAEKLGARGILIASAIMEGNQEEIKKLLT
jgi:triosephosphate isomerase